MIVFEQVSVTYDGSTMPTLDGVDLVVPEGELCVVIGPTGSGKSTLLGAINGLVPHFTGGLLRGRIAVDGRDTATHRPRELADVVGFVGQDPVAGFVSDRVERELAFGMEQLGLPADVMRKRVEETLDLMGLADVRDRPLLSLSGGQQQRVAIGAVLAAHPRVLVLDEPTSALDPTAAEEVLAAIGRLVHDLGVTAVIAEHRLERIIGQADLVVEVQGNGVVRSGTPASILIDSAVAPPVAQLGRLAGWNPLPLDVRDARRMAAPLRAQLDGRQPAGPQLPGDVPRSAPPVLAARTVRVHHGQVEAVRDVDLDLAAGQVVALMGRNGSGKSSLLWALQGSGPRTSGTVRIADDGGGEGRGVGVDPRDLGARAARQQIALVPQEPADLLYHSTVADECAQADADADAAPDSCRDLLGSILPGIPADQHPRDLSEGQRLALVLAIQLVAGPRVLLLDEPTRGLDYTAKDALARALRTLADDGRAVVVSTHDVEFVAGACDRVVVLSQGEVVADGPTAQVVVSSPTFAPQVAKVMRPQPWLTVAQVAQALQPRAVGSR